ncbi:MAG: hypothetical protein ACRD1U_13925 [Vicinamibacterales bacterium]
MDLVLVGITTISLVLAIGMGVVLFRIWREERLRSDARAVLLSQAAAQAEAALSKRLTGEPASALHLRAEVDAPADLFAVRETPSPWGERLAIAGAIAAVVAVAGFALSGGRSVRAGSEGAGAAPPAATLELVALRHTREEHAIVVSGIVHNPRTGTALSDVAATALVFGADGALLATGAAGLDFTTLAPGDESPFVIKVPVSGNVSKYRIGFKRRDGGVIPHVDRRSDGSSARTALRTHAAGPIARAAVPGSVPWVP